MTALLRSVLRRYFRSRLCLAFQMLCLLAGTITGIFVYQFHQNFKTPAFHAEFYLYPVCTVLFLICSGVALMIGGAFADGVIRLQCIHGYSKEKIASAHLIGALIWSFVCGLLIMIPFILSTKLQMMPYLSGKMTQVMLPLLMMFPAWGIAVAAITLLLRNRALSALAGIAVLFGLIFFSMNAEMQLDEPKYRCEVVYNYIYTEEALDARQPTATEKMIPNEWYIPKPQRDRTELCYLLDPLTPIAEEGWFLSNATDDFTNADQFNKEMQSFHRARRKFLPLFQCVTLLILSTVTVFCFKRRNLT